MATLTTEQFIEKLQSYMIEEGILDITLVADLGVFCEPTQSAFQTLCRDQGRDGYPEQFETPSMFSPDWLVDLLAGYTPVDLLDVQQDIIEADETIPSPPSPPAPPPVEEVVTPPPVEETTPPVDTPPVDPVTPPVEEPPPSPPAPPVEEVTPPVENNSPPADPVVEETPPPSPPAPPVDETPPPAPPAPPEETPPA